MRILKLLVAVLVLMVGKNGLAGDAMSHFNVKSNVAGNASVNADKVDEITWTDSQGQPRTVHFVTESSRFNPGWLSQYSYDVPAITCLATTSAVGGLSDISHMEGTGNAGGTKRTPKEKGEMGSIHPKFKWVFKGANHGIVRVEYDMEYAKNKAATGKTFHIIRDLMFSAGNDHIVYSLTMDFSGNPKDEVDVDTRSPYMEWGWSGEPFKLYTGFKCGTDSTLSCPDTQAPNAKITKTLNDNIIPYNVLWDAPKDRLCAMIATRPYSEWPQASEYFPGDSSHIIPAGTYDRDKLDAWKLPYQIGAYANWYQKITWQMPGHLGHEEITFGKDYKMKAWPKYSYAVMVLLDKFSRKQDARLVKEGEMIPKIKLTATQGTVATSGPSGAGRETEEAKLTTPGYDPQYRVWRASCDKNALSLSMVLNGATLLDPVFIFDQYAGSKTPSITLNGQKLEDGKDFYASLDGASKRLYVTLLTTLKGKADLSF